MGFFDGLIQLAYFGGTDTLFQIYGDVSSGFQSHSELPYG